MTGGRLRALTAAILTCLVPLLGGGPAVAGPVVPEALVAAERRPQTDGEEAAEVRRVLVLVGALLVLTVVVGAVAARRR